jgi:hypothetical protein
VIAVFTKYDQFRRDTMIKLEDQHRDPALLDSELERIFNEQYLAGLTGPPPFIRLESEDFNNQQICVILISRLQKCTNLANRVMVLSRSLLTHSRAVSLP